MRFLLIGAANTALGYGLFVAFELTVGHRIGYLGSLYVSYAIAIVVAFVLHRRFTFRVAGSGNVLVDFLRFVSVHLVALLVNTAALPLLVEFAGLSPMLAQAIVVLATTVISYLGHKFFSFRRAAVSTESPSDPPVRA